VRAQPGNFSALDPRERRLLRAAVARSLPSSPPPSPAPFWKTRPLGRPGPLGLRWALLRLLTGPPLENEGPYSDSVSREAVPGAVYSDRASQERAPGLHPYALGAHRGKPRDTRPELGVHAGFPVPTWCWASGGGVRGRAGAGQELLHLRPSARLQCGGARRSQVPDSRGRGQGP